jgi:hypothetical protein
MITVPHSDRGIATSPAQYWYTVWLAIPRFLCKISHKAPVAELFKTLVKKKPLSPYIYGPRFIKILILNRAIFLLRIQTQVFMTKNL